MPAHDVTIGLKPSQQFTTIDTLRRVWGLADGGGFDSLWVFDHFAPMGPARDGDVFEAWTLMAAMAEATERVRIGSLVSGNIYRQPGVLAKMAVTVDHLSAGRLELGLGAGGDDHPDAMLGIAERPASDRIDALAEACHVLRSLWAQPTSDFAGRHYTLTGARSDPKPVQRPLPLWVGSSGPRRGLRVVAEHADGWFSACMPSEGPEGPIALGRVLDEHCTELGRDPSDVRRGAQFPLGADADATLRLAEAYVRAGFDTVVLMLFQPGDGAVAEAEAALDVLPRLRTLG